MLDDEAYYVGEWQALHFQNLNADHVDCTAPARDKLSLRLISRKAVAGRLHALAYTPCISYLRIQLATDLRRNKGALYGQSISDVRIVENVAPSGFRRETLACRDPLNVGHVGALGSKSSSSS